MSDQGRTLDYGDRGTVIVVPDSNDLARMAAETLITVSAEAAAESRRALVALSGGSTPKKMGELLAAPEYTDRVHWEALQIFWGDERWVPLADSQSNAGEAIRGFLQDSPIPDENIHPWQTESGIDPAVAAERYERLIREISGVNEGIPVFDLIFLGMGDDGHTLSLFPGTDAVNDTTSLTMAHHVAKLNADRVTFGRALTNAARKIIFLVGGQSKADMLHQVLDGHIDIDNMPSQSIQPETGSLLWLVDEAAAASLEHNHVAG
jgi:6-phosphogluconolactonase